MKAMILAAGRGKRMMPLTTDLPKPMLPVAGKPLLQYHIERCVAAGIRDIVINLAWQGSKIKEYFADGSKFGASIVYSQEPEEGLETAGGIKQALPLLENETNTFIVLNGDVYTDYDVHTLSQLVLHDGEAHLVLVENPAHNPKGDFPLIGQPANLQKYTFSGIARYHSSFFGDVSEGVIALGPILRNKLTKNVVSTELYLGVWEDVGTPERLAKINEQVEAKYVG
ncbi:Glucose-1-phosphate thymidylyltransferase [Pseudoalteromonas luteoviolacea B = ATCC 29581]|nr:Glucose-1-phosphate thymidylyltransferase [Pseudoalteromonas luteoviolacea B = ATCC 29581]